MDTNLTQSTQKHISVTLLNAGEELRCFTRCQDTVTVGLVLCGSITMHLLGKCHNLSSGDIYTAAPNTVHSLTAFSDDVQLLQLTFSMDVIRCQEEHFFYRDFWEPLSKKAVQLPSHLSATFPATTQIHKLLLTILHTTDPLQHFVCLMELCLQLIPHCVYAPNNTPNLGISNQTVQYCMIYIINHYHKKLCLKTLARYLNCHPNYLCSIFKAHTGQTVIEYLYQTRVEAAAEILREKDLPIGKISELAGFPNRNMFYKKFRQIMGVSPTTYREKYSTH